MPRLTIPKSETPIDALLGSVPESTLKNAAMALAEAFGLSQKDVFPAPLSPVIKAGGTARIGAIKKLLKEEPGFRAFHGTKSPEKLAKEGFKSRFANPVHDVAGEPLSANVSVDPQIAEQFGSPFSVFVKSKPKEILRASGTDLKELEKLYNSVLRGSKHSRVADKFDRIITRRNDDIARLEGLLDSAKDRVTVRLLKKKILVLENAKNANVKSSVKAYIRAKREAGETLKSTLLKRGFKSVYFPTQGERGLVRILQPEQDLFVISPSGNVDKIFDPGDTLSKRFLKFEEQLERFMRGAPKK